MHDYDMSTIPFNSAPFGEITNRWRQILHQKKYGDAKLQYLVGFTEEQLYFLENLVILNKQKGSWGKNRSGVSILLNVKFEGRKIQVEGNTAKGSPSEIKMDMDLFTFDKTQEKILAEWLLEL